MMKIKPILKTLLFLILFQNSYYYIAAQSNTIVYSPNDFEPIKKVLNDYRGLYTQIDNVVSGEANAIADQEFKLSFNDNYKQTPLIAIDYPSDEEIIKISIQPYKLGEKVTLEQYISSLKRLINNNIIISCEISPSTKYYYCSKSHGGDWYVYLTKKFTYKHVRSEESLTTYSKITLSPKAGNANDYKIIDIEAISSIPSDKDHDFIIDNCDNCPNSPKLKSNKNKTIALTPGGCEAKNMYRKHPSTRMGFTFSAGLLSPLSTQVLEKDISNNMLIIKPNYFYKRGLIITTEYEYIISNKLNVFIGTSFMRNQLDSKNMQKEVRDIMVENFRTDTFAFQRLTRDIYNPYIGFSIGNFSHKKNVVTLGFLLGIAIPAEKGKYLEFTNYSVTSADLSISIIEQKYKAAFNAAPFLTEGIRLKYEYSFLHEGSGKVFLLLNMLTGNMDFPDSYIGTPGNYQIRFDGGRIYLWSAQIGFNFCIKKPKILVEQNRFFESKKLMN